MGCLTSYIVLPYIVVLLRRYQSEVPVAAQAEAFRASSDVCS